MPPALHPRSRMTLSLFSSTLALSFLVVGLPHIIPCPVPHSTRVYADGTVMRRRRKSTSNEDTDTIAGHEQRKPVGRECPVPKPGGLIGKVLGFEQEEPQVVTRVKVEKFTPMKRGASNNTES